MTEKRARTVLSRLCIALGLYGVLALALLAVPAAAVIAPYAQTAAPAPSGAGYELRGTIYTYGSDTHYHFEYGTTTAYGTSIPVPDADAGSQSYVSVGQVVSGLQPGTTYHFRLLASNAGGTGTSADATFTTAAGSTAPQPAGAESPASATNPYAAGGSYTGSGAYGEGGAYGGEGAGSAPAGRTVRLRIVTVKGKRILADPRGHTLYSLSAERRGKFVCTRSSGCLNVWKPLLVPTRGTVKGPVKLGSVQRPEGGRQVTYRGRPLYAFGLDRKPGTTKGEGIKDVGTWHAVQVPKPRR